MQPQMNAKQPGLVYAEPPMMGQQPVYSTAPQVAPTQYYQPMPQQVSAQVMPQQQPMSTQVQHTQLTQGYPAQNEGDGQGALILFILGFFWTWAWLICWLRYRNSPHPEAKKWQSASKILFFIGLILNGVAASGIIIAVVVSNLTVRSSY